MVLPGSLQGPKKSQIVVFEEKKLLLENSSIGFENNSGRTLPLTISPQDPKTFTVLPPSGATPDINKTWVQMAIIKNPFFLEGGTLPAGRILIPSNSMWINEGEDGIPYFKNYDITWNDFIM